MKCFHYFKAHSIHYFTGQEVTDEELENLLDRQAEIFNQNILMETQVAKQRLLDVQQRHDDVIKIEKSIIEVNQLFQVIIIVKLLLFLVVTIAD